MKNGVTCGGWVGPRSSHLFYQAKASGLEIRSGNRVPCPFCGKPVMLRDPFNTGIQNIQIPHHKHATIGAREDIAKATQ